VAYGRLTGEKQRPARSIGFFDAKWSKARAMELGLKVCFAIISASARLMKQRLDASTFHAWCMQLTHRVPQAFGCKGKFCNRSGRPATIIQEIVWCEKTGELPYSTINSKYGASDINWLRKRIGLRRNPVRRQTEIQISASARRGNCAIALKIPKIPFFTEF